MPADIPAALPDLRAVPLDALPLADLAGLVQRVLPVTDPAPKAAVARNFSSAL